MPPSPEVAALVPWLLAVVAEWAYALIWVLFGALLAGYEVAAPAVPGVEVLLLGLLALGLLWEGSLSERLLRRERARAAVRAALALAALAGGALVVWRTVGGGGALLAGGAVAGWYGCYQGLQLGRSGIDYHRLAQRFGFQAPLLVLGLLAMLAAGAGGRPAVVGVAGFALAGYFGTALAGLALGRQRDALAHQAAAGEEGRPALTPVTAALLAGLVLVLGLLTSGTAGALLASRLWAAVLRGGGGLLVMVFRLVWLIAYRIALLAVIALLPLYRLFTHGLPEAEKPQPLAPVSVRPIAIPPETAARITGLVLVLAGLLALVLLAAVLRRRRRRAPVRTGEMRESIFSWALLVEDLRAVLTWLFGWVRRRPHPPAAAAPAKGPVTGGPLDLRALYRALQRLGSALGRPRQPGQTPRQYQAALALRLPPGAGHVAAITGPYERLRYGPVAPDDPEVEAAREGLQALQALQAAESEAEARS